jgi:transcriptional regulator with XRE-family HTH domain
MGTMSLAQRVRDYRYSKGWGPDELASRAAISRTALYQIESGKTELPRAGTLRRIALALEVPMETLLGHSETASSTGVPQPAGSAGWRARGNAEWIPSEGGPLTVPPGRSGARPIESVEPSSRFGVEAQAPLPTGHEAMGPARERELAWKLRELLATPLGEGVSRIIEESYRVWSQSHLSG